MTGVNDASQEFMCLQQAVQRFQDQVKFSPCSNNPVLAMPSMCTHRKSFHSHRRALKLQTLLTEGKPGLEVSVNPEKVRVDKATEEARQHICAVQLPLSSEIELSLSCFSPGRDASKCGIQTQEKRTYHCW